MLFIPPYIGGEQGDTMSTELSVDTKTELKVPTLYKVILLNDDYTPMEFVIQILTEIFNKNAAEAEALTIQVHSAGRGVAGTYTKEVAEQKSNECKVIAASYRHPLKTIVEAA
jgi:ATP-dependent Clp protease adaptor protein ClpS